MSDLKARLAGIVEERKAQTAAIEAVMPSSELEAAAADHAAQQFANLLDDGEEEGAAMEKALAENARRIAYLSRIATLFATSPARVTLPCSTHGSDQEMATERDANGETIAYCLCGSFRKIAAE
jgi:hypothetical protein